MAIRLLSEYLDTPAKKKSGQLTPALRKGAKRFIRTKFMDQGPRMYRCYYFDTPTFDNHTTGVNEGIHRGLKKSSVGPDACDSIDKSQKNIDIVFSVKAKKRRKQAANDMMSMAAAEEDRKYLLTELTRKCNKILRKEHVASPKFGVYCLPCEGEEERAYYVRLNEDEHGRYLKPGEAPSDAPLQTASLEKASQGFEERLWNRMAWYIPSFARTRKVVIKKEHGSWVAVCSCMMYTRHQKCCRHVYAVLDRHPVPTDASIRHFNIYHRDFMMDDDELTERLRSLRDDTPLTGVPIQLDDLITEGRGRQDLNFYEEAYGATVLRGPSHWTEVRKCKHMSEIPRRKKLFGVVKETHLSNRQLQLNQGRGGGGVTLSGVGDNDFDDGAHSEADDFPMVDDDSDNQDEPAQDISQFQPGNAGLLLQPICNGLFDDVVTEEQFLLARDRLHRLRQDILGLSAPNMPNHNPTGTVSLPETQRARTEPRRRKVSSPPPRGGKKRKDKGG